MIFNIDKSRDSNLGTILETTPTPQGLERTANPQVNPVVTPRLSRGGVGRGIHWLLHYIWTIYPGTIIFCTPCVSHEKHSQVLQGNQMKIPEPKPRGSRKWQKSQECIHVTTNGFIGCCLIFHMSKSIFCSWCPSCSFTYADIWLCFLKSLFWSTDCSFWAQFPTLWLINSFEAPCKSPEMTFRASQKKRVTISMLAMFCQFSLFWYNRWEFHCER